MDALRPDGNIHCRTLWISDVHLTPEKGFDGIICGHLHHPVIERYDDVLYCNDGDCVESCSALLEDADGQLHLIKAVGSTANIREMVLAAA